MLSFSMKCNFFRKKFFNPPYIATTQRYSTPQLFIISLALFVKNFKRRIEKEEKQRQEEERNNVEERI